MISAFRSNFSAFFTTHFLSHAVPCSLLAANWELVGIGVGRCRWWLLLFAQVHGRGRITNWWTLPGKFSRCVNFTTPSGMCLPVGAIEIA